MKGKERKEVSDDSDDSGNNNDNNSPGPYGLPLFSIGCQCSSCSRGVSTLIFTGLKK